MGKSMEDINRMNLLKLAKRKIQDGRGRGEGGILSRDVWRWCRRGNQNGVCTYRNKPKTRFSNNQFVQVIFLFPPYSQRDISRFNDSGLVENRQRGVRMRVEKRRKERKNEQFPKLTFVFLL